MCFGISGTTQSHETDFSDFKRQSCPMALAIARLYPCPSWNRLSNPYSLYTEWTQMLEDFSWLWDTHCLRLRILRLLSFCVFSRNITLSLPYSLPSPTLAPFPGLGPLIKSAKASVEVESELALQKGMVVRAEALESETWFESQLSHWKLCDLE